MFGTLSKDYIEFSAHSRELGAGNYKSSSILLVPGDPAGATALGLRTKFRSHIRTFTEESV